MTFWIIFSRYIYNYLNLFEYYNALTLFEKRMETLINLWHSMPPVAKTVLLLLISNTFMSFAWYAHLKNLGSAPLWVAIVTSWLIAFFEYIVMIPANRIGFGSLSLGQLKILQEIVSLSIFVPFAVLYMKEPLKLDYLWAALCMLGAAYFIFRDHV